MAGPGQNGRGPSDDNNTTYTGGDDDYDDLDEVDSGEAGYKTVKDAVLFAIQINESMLATPSTTGQKQNTRVTSPAIAALKCAHALMQQRIISHPLDMMGVMLFGTRETFMGEGNDQDDGAGVGLQFPNCYVLTSLDIPAADDVKALRRYVEDEDAAAGILQSSDDEVNMANVLFCANQIFTTKAPNFSSRRLFLVTDNDNPHKDNRAARNSAAVRAKDLYDLGVTIDLFPISHPDRDFEFDRAKFYNDIVYPSVPSDPEAPAPLVPDISPSSSSTKDGLGLLESLLSAVASRAAPRRAMFSNVPFEIGPGLRIGVKGYIILKKQEPKRTSYIYLPPDAEKPQVAVGTTTLVADDTARSVEKVQIRKAYKFGGETVTFSEEEISKIKNFGDPIIRMIGFKPLSLLPTWANFKHNTFLYPSEDDYVGSTRVFGALYQKLLRDARFGLAWYIPRRNAVPVLAAIYPSNSTATYSASPTTPSTFPAGLYLKPLPTADSIRSPPATLPPPPRLPDTFIDATRTLIQQLHLPRGIYNPSKYPNPSLQHFYRILQALALDEDLPEEVDDKTLPRVKQMHKRIAPYTEAWKAELKEVANHAFNGKRDGGGEEDEKEEEEEGGDVGRAGSKRSAGTSTHKSPAKRARRESFASSTTVPAVVADAMVRKAYDRDELEGFKVAELKGWLVAKGVEKGVDGQAPVALKGLKKGELVEVVQGWFERKGGR